MKKRFVCGVFALCLALSVAGCGKSPEEKQAANYYQNELGLDKEDAEQLAHELYGKDKDEEKPSVTEAPKEIVIEPLPELVNSEWWERKVQIYDMVFTDDLYMTEEDIRKIVAGSAYNVELPEVFDSNGEVCIRDLMVDGKQVAQLWKGTRRYPSDVEYEFFDDGYCYEIGYGNVYEGIWYDKASIEFEDFKTRDDVLAYLAENGFVEVEKEQAPYTYKEASDRRMIFPDEIPTEFADVPHYYCKGAQSITIFRMHKLGETDQVIECNHGYAGTYHYSGAHLNLVNYVTFVFKTDGTIDVSTKFEYYGPYWEEANNTSGDRLGWYLPDCYDQSNSSRVITIVGERID